MIRHTFNKCYKGKTYPVKTHTMTNKEYVEMQRKQTCCMDTVQMLDRNGQRMIVKFTSFLGRKYIVVYTIV